MTEKAAKRERNTERRRKGELTGPRNNDEARGRKQAKKRRSVPLTSFDSPSSFSSLIEFPKNVGTTKWRTMIDDVAMEEAEKEEDRGEEEEPERPEERGRQRKKS